MDPYGFSLALGAAGLTVMGLRGLGSHGHGGAPAHAGHGHDGVHHTGPLHHGAAGGAHDAGHAGSGPGHHDPGAGHAATAGHAHGHPIAKFTSRDAFWALASPRVWFSFLVGAGATGLIARLWLIEPLVAVCAVTGGVIFERYVVSPLWRLLLRFESRPAATLESILFEEARAETDFDADGRGLISVELDGQIVQLLGRLKPEDRKPGVRIRRGSRMRIEAVDGARNRCTVSYLGDALPGEEP